MNIKESFLRRQADVCVVGARAVRRVRMLRWLYVAVGPTSARRQIWPYARKSRVGLYVPFTLGSNYFPSLHSSTLFLPSCFLALKTMSPAKRRRLSEGVDNSDTSDIAPQSEDDGHKSEGSGSSSQSAGAESMSGNEGMDTEDEIVEAQRNQKSKKTQKRKRRATSPSRFGAALQSLLSTNAPASQPLSLKPSVAKKRKDEILEVKAKRVLEGEKKEKEEKNHITDVIGGWGGESERSLRKVAQRGGEHLSYQPYVNSSDGRCTVVKLFNAIQQAQSAATAAGEEARSSRGSGKPTLPAPAIKNKGKKSTAQPGLAGISSNSGCNVFAYLSPSLRIWQA